MKRNSNAYMIGWNRAIGFMLSDTRNARADFKAAAAKRCDDIADTVRDEAIRGFVAYCEQHAN